MKVSKQIFVKHFVGSVAAAITLVAGVAFVSMLNAGHTLFLAGPVGTDPVRNEAAVNIKSDDNHDSVSPPSTELSCYDLDILPIWRELKKDSMFRARIGLNDGQVNCSEIVDIKRVDLNRDGSDEFLARGKGSRMCDGNDNCGFWIFGKRERRTALLLYGTDYYDDYGELGEQIQRARRVGYSNILLKGHFREAETVYTTYAFYSGTYIASHCSVEVPGWERGSGQFWEMITCSEWERRLGEQK